MSRNGPSKKILAAFGGDRSPNKARFLREVHDAGAHFFLITGGLRKPEPYVVLDQSGHIALYSPSKMVSNPSEGYQVASDPQLIEDAQKLVCAKYLAGKLYDLNESGHEEASAFNKGDTYYCSLDGKYVLSSNGEVLVPRGQEMVAVPLAQVESILSEIHERVGEIERVVSHSPLQEDASKFPWSRRKAIQSAKPEVESPVHFTAVANPSEAERGNVSSAAPDQASSSKTLIKLPGVHTGHMAILAESLRDNNVNFFEIGKFSQRENDDPAEQLKLKIHHDVASNQFTLGFTNNKNEFEPLTINSSFFEKETSQEERLAVVTKLAQSSMGVFKDSMEQVSSRAQQSSHQQEEGESWRARMLLRSSSQTVPQH